MKKNPVLVGFAILGGLLLVFGFAVLAALKGTFGERQISFGRNSVLVMEVKGVITDSKQFIKDLRRYGEDSEVKAIVVRLDTPGGVVGPSQEIYQAIKRIRKMGRTVVASMGSVAASGGYYIAAGCDKIFTNPGTITGSIGVIMEFADISRLYDWAKINRYVIKTGPYKDTGAEFRPMSADERAVMQGMIDNVFGQFKRAVSEGRNLPIEKVNRLADGRIYSGEQAVKLGLADGEGGLEDAIEFAARLAGIKGEPTPFYPPKSRPKIWEYLLKDKEDDDESKIEQLAKKILHTEFIGRPLFLMPGALGW